MTVAGTKYKSNQRRMASSAGRNRSNPKALAAEQVISNRFYQDYDTARKKSRVAQLAERFRRRGNSPKAPVAAR